MKGVNEDEITDLIKLLEIQLIYIQFVEIMLLNGN